MKVAMSFNRTDMINGGNKDTFNEGSAKQSIAGCYARKYGKHRIPLWHKTVLSIPCHKKFTTASK